ncbi:MAG: hypothetical protein GWP19_05785 [Planctomycetia bacterium]|nr:hypothetical protein [Planctomycetia bacterium]
MPISIYSQYAISGDVYFKGTVGKGFVNEQVFTGISITLEDGTIDDIYISPGGGLNIEWGMGLHISSTLKTEFDVTYQYSGDKFGNGTVLFRKFPISLALIKEYQRNESYLLYGKVGALAILTPKYFDEIDGSKFRINYHNTYAGQIGIGLMRRIESERVYFFFEGIYVFSKNLNWKSATLDDVESTPSPTFKSLNNNGIFLNIGLGYYY